MSDHEDGKPQTTSEAEQPKGLMAKFLGAIEWAGNTLPHPVTLFFLFAVGIIIASAICAALGVEVADPRPEGARGRAEDGMIRAVSLLSADGFRWLVTSMVDNFAGFRPLGTVLVALLGVGVAEKSGVLGAVIRAMVLAAPKSLVTVVIVFSGIVSNTASEMGYVVLIPLAATVYYALGRHPLAGLAAAFAGVSGGYSANLLIGTVDPLLAGITEEAARFVDPEYVVHPAVNWYFMIVSTFLITIVGSWVSLKIVEPRLGKYDSAKADKSISRDPSLSALTKEEKRGLKLAGLSCLAMIVAMVYLWGPFRQVEPESWLHPVRELVSALPAYGVLGIPEGGQLRDAALLSGVVAAIFVFFVIPGFVYGRAVGTMRTDRDIIDAMADAMGTMGLYIVLVFFAAQFVAYFAYTNLGQILAVVGADALVALNLDNPLVFIPFILMCCIVNLVLGSASAQWAVTAPIFVPMLMGIGYSPEVIQAAYRIGDSSTNIVTPMMSYFGLILAFACRYDKKLGIGTLVATMLPYTIFFLIGWVALFYTWVFLLGLPVGPGAPTYYEPAPVEEAVEAVGMMSSALPSIRAF